MTQRDHSVWHLSVCLSICLSGSHTFLVVMLFLVVTRYGSQATHAFISVLTFWLSIRRHEVIRSYGHLPVHNLGLRSAPKISVLRGSEGPVRVSILEFRISVRFVLYIALSTQQCWRWENNLSFEASDSKLPFMLIMKHLLELVC